MQRFYGNLCCASGIIVHILLTSFYLLSEFNQLRISRVLFSVQVLASKLFISSQFFLYVASLKVNLNIQGKEKNSAKIIFYIYYFGCVEFFIEKSFKIIRQQIGLIPQD